MYQLTDRRTNITLLVAYVYDVGAALMGLTVKLISSGSCIQIADCTAACITPTHTGLAEEHSNNLLNLPQRQQIAVHHRILPYYY